MRYRGIAAAVVVAASLPLTACSSTADAATIAWIDKVCGVSVKLGDVFAAVKPMNDEPAKVKAQSVSESDARVTAIDQAVSDLNALKKGPHADSEKYVSPLVDMYTKMKPSLERARNAIRSADEQDPTAVNAALATIDKETDEVNRIRSGYQSVTIAADLADAEGKAANCKKLPSANKK
ncbi:hypothetical protein [Amycolatopsis sp. NPDC059021]|uniref:hypothetical protein n=1 Tax=Amycolatopsis sp. NPDC059021 TaxID=3346704 RepID=UPI00366E7657